MTEKKKSHTHTLTGRESGGGGRAEQEQKGRKSRVMGWLRYGEGGNLPPTGEVVVGAGPAVVVSHASSWRFCLTASVMLWI